MDYRRAWHEGGTYFFTLNLLQRRDYDLLVRYIDDLRSVVKKVKSKHPFIIHGWVVLPEHLHCVIELPSHDADFATRLRLIKAGFSKSVPKTEFLSDVRIKRGELVGRNSLRIAPYNILLTAYYVALIRPTIICHNDCNI